MRKRKRREAEGREREGSRNRDRARNKAALFAEDKHVNRYNSTIM